MAFRPMDPLPSPEEVLARLEPKPGEAYGYISHDDVLFGWLYFLSVIHGVQPASTASTGALPWALSKAYPAGSLVQFNGLVYVATTKVAAMGTDPASGAPWKVVGAPPTVTVDKTAGQTPTTNPPSKTQDGDVFINTVDNLLWIYDTTEKWVQTQAGLPKVTLLTTAGQTPTTNPPAGPKEGDLFINSTDRSSWAYDDDTKKWYALAHSPKVNISHTAGSDPVTNPPANTEIGDWYINDVDGNNWIYAVGGGGATAPAAGWQAATPGTGNVYVSDTAGEVPANAATGQTNYTFPTTATLSEGDRFVNRTDHVSWVYAPDPKNKGSFIWIELTAENTATISVTAKEVPENPATGQTAHNFTVPPKIGDIFINRPDGLSWVRVKNPATGGAAAIWEPVQSGTSINLELQGTQGGGKFPLTNPNLDPAWNDASKRKDGDLIITPTGMWKWYVDPMQAVRESSVAITGPSWVHVVPFFNTANTRFFNGKDPNTGRMNDGQLQGQRLVTPYGMWSWSDKNHGPATQVHLNGGQQGNDVANAAALPAQASHHDYVRTLDDNHTHRFDQTTPGPTISNGPGTWTDLGVVAHQWLHRWDFVQAETLFKPTHEMPNGDPTQDRSLDSPPAGITHLVTEKAVWVHTSNAAVAAMDAEPNAMRLAQGLSGYAAGHWDTATTLQTGVARYTPQTGDLAITEDTNHAWIYDGATWQDTGNTYAVTGLKWVKDFDFVGGTDVRFRSSYELNNYAPRAGDVGTSGGYMVTPKAVWVWVDSPQWEAERAMAKRQTFPGTYLGATLPTTRPNGSAIQQGDFFVDSADTQGMGADHVLVWGTGAWTDSGVVIADPSALPDGGKWVKDFDTQIPVWSNTETYDSGQLVLVPPAAGAPWTLYRVSNALAGRTTAGASPTTSTDWEAVGSVGGAGGTNLQIIGPTVGFPQGRNPNDTNLRWANGNGAAAGDYLITPDAAYRWCPSASDAISTVLGFPTGWTPANNPITDTTDATAMAPYDVDPTTVALRNYVRDVINLQADILTDLGGKPPVPGLGDMWSIQSAPNSSDAWMYYLVSAATGQIGQVNDKNQNPVVFPYNPWANGITGWVKILDFAGGSGGNIAPLFSQQVGTLAGGAATPLSTRIGPGGIVPIGPDPTFTANPPTEIDPAKTWPQTNKEPAGTKVGETRITEHGVLVWDGSAWVMGFESVGWARPYDQYRDAKTGAAISDPMIAEWPKPDANGDYPRRTRYRDHGDVWEFRDVRKSSGVPFDFMLPLATVTGTTLGYQSFHRDDLTTVGAQMPGRNTVLDLDIPPTLKPTPNMPGPGDTIDPTNPPTDGLLARFQMRDALAPENPGQWHYTGALYIDQTGQMRLFLGTLVDANTAPATVSAALPPLVVAGIPMNLTTGPLPLGVRHKSLKIGFLTINNTGVYVANNGLPYFAISDGSSAAALMALPAPAATSPSDFFIRTEWVSREVQVYDVSEGATAKHMNASQLLANARGVDTDGNGTQDVDEINKWVWEIVDTTVFGIVRRVPINQAGGWSKVGKVTDTVRWWSQPPLLPQWRAETHPTDSIVQYQGKMYVAMQDTLATDVPNAPFVVGQTPPWKELPPATAVTLDTVAGHSPLTNPPPVPHEGDLFVNSTDSQSWVCTSAKAWIPLAKMPTITIAQVSGQTPQTDPPPAAPQIGDWYINEVDDQNWLYAVGGGAAVAPASGWQPATASTGNVYLSDTAQVVPVLSVPAVAGETAFTFPTGTTLAEGDRFVNRTDHTNYVYAPDPANAGQFIWVKLPTDAAATVSTTANEVPENPAAGETLFTFQRPARIGDLFYNAADKRLWMRSANPAGGADIWQRVTDTSVTVSGNLGSTPAPATGAPLPGNVGDEYVNTADRRNWVHDGTQWVERQTSLPPTATHVAGDVLSIVNPATGVVDWAAAGASGVFAGVIGNASAPVQHRWQWSDFFGLGAQLPDGVKIEVHEQGTNTPASVLQVGKAYSIIVDWGTSGPNAQFEVDIGGNPTMFVPADGTTISIPRIGTGDLPIQVSYWSDLLGQESARLTLGATGFAPVHDASVVMSAATNSIKTQQMLRIDHLVNGRIPAKVVSIGGRSATIGQMVMLHRTGSNITLDLLPIDASAVVGGGIGSVTFSTTAGQTPL